MHQITLDTKIPTVTECINVLHANNQRMGIPMDYDRLLEYHAAYTIRGNEIKRRIMRYINFKSDNPHDLTANEFCAFLKRAGVTTGFKLTKRGAISMDAESLQGIIDTGLYSDEICKIIDLWSKASTCFSTIGTFAKIIDNHQPAAVESYDNHRMIFVRPTWTSQNTGRLGAENPGLLNMPKSCPDIWTVPKGWIKVEADSGQIDPRISQSTIISDPVLKRCTMAYNDAYYGYVHYCRILTDEERRNPDTKIVPMELTEEMANMRKKYKTFGNATLYGSTENRANDPDKALFIRYIGGHPKRVALQHDLEDRIERGQRVFTTAFGTPIDITKGPSDNNYEDKTSDAYFSHLLKCAINNPIQGAAADLMRYNIVATNNMLNRKAPNSVILMSVHDSLKFAVHESDYENIKDELKTITAYQVEDWIPICCDYEEGIKQGSLKRFIV